MFGKIVGIEKNCIRVLNLSKKTELSLINIHVIFEKGNSKIVGSIYNISEEFIDIMLIGEILDSVFIPGDIRKPSLDSKCRIIFKNELECILGRQNYNEKDTLLIGNSEIYNNIKITVNKNSFFSSHFAILGNTGAGKSCGMTRLIQNIFYYNNEQTSPVNAHFVVFDAYGDYKNAFSTLNKMPGLSFKQASFGLGTDTENVIKIPPYFLDVDDLAILLDVNKPEIIPIISSTLRIAYIFTANDEKVKAYKNSIIASSLQDILSSGKPSTQIRDQIQAVLTKFNTADINLNTIISQPGYDRTLKQCLLIDKQGKLNAMNLIVEFLTPFIQHDLDNIEVKKGFVYTLDDLYHALEFSLINEGILSNQAAFEQLNSLRVRLRSIINSDVKNVFEIDRVITKEEFVFNFFKNSNGKNAQIVDVNFGNLDERTVKMLTKILSKLFFTFVTELQNRGSFPIHLIIEEAHRYVQNDSDIAVIGYNIFERIIKEGRKYGIIMGLITQKPTELSKTVLSQCANFIVFRMYYPEDVDIVTSLSTNVTADLKEKLKILHPGMALCFGNSFNIPLIAQFDLPNPMPISSDIEVNNLWY